MYDFQDCYDGYYNFDEFPDEFYIQYVSEKYNLSSAPEALHVLIEQLFECNSVDREVFDSGMVYLSEWAGINTELLYHGASPDWEINDYSQRNELTNEDLESIEALFYFLEPEDAVFAIVNELYVKNSVNKVRLIAAFINLCKFFNISVARLECGPCV